MKYLNNVLEGDHGRLKRILGPKGAFKNLDVCLPNSERDGSDAFIAERSGDDVCLRATEPGCGDRQPGLRDGLTTPTRSGHQGMRNWVFAALRPALQQHPFEVDGVPEHDRLTGVIEVRDRLWLRYLIHYADQAPRMPPLARVGYVTLEDSAGSTRKDRRESPAFPDALQT